MPRWGGRNYSNRIPGALPLAGLFNPFGVYRDISPDSNYYLYIHTRAKYIFSYISYIATS